MYVTYVQLNVPLTRRILLITYVEHTVKYFILKFRVNRYRYVRVFELLYTALLHSTDTSTDVWVYGECEKFLPKMEGPSVCLCVDTAVKDRWSYLSLRRDKITVKGHLHIFAASMANGQLHVFAFKDKKPHLKFIDKHWDAVKKSTTVAVDANDGTVPGSCKCLIAILIKDCQ